MKRTRNQRKAFGRLMSKLGSPAKLMKAIDTPSFFRNWLGGILLREGLQKPQLEILPLKHLRLQQLADAGLNTPPSRHWLRGELNPSELKVFLEEHKRISLRNFREERILEQTPKLPVKYDKSGWDLIYDFCAEHNKHYHTLVNKALPVEDSLMAGNIILLDDERYLVSYFEGYGTPRDVDDKPKLKVFLSFFNSPMPKWAPEELEELIGKIRSSHMDFSPITPKTFEFSIYPYPVGLLQRPEVFWEWRSGSAHDMYTIISRLLERVDSHEMIFNLPRLGEVSLGLPDNRYRLSDI